MIQADTGPTSSQLLEAARTEMGPPRVLLAEDDDELRGLLIDALELEGYEVVPAEDGFDLLRRIGRPGTPSTWCSRTFACPAAPGCRRWGRCGSRTGRLQSSS